MKKNREKGKQKLWYVRQGRKVTGPFPCGAVRRSLLLGRITLDDDVSSNGKQWDIISTVPEVMPPELRKAIEDGDKETLLIGRMREDTRLGKERRTDQDDKMYRHRRQNQRRSEESEIQTKRQAARTVLLNQSLEQIPRGSIVLSILLVISIVGFGLFYRASSDSRNSDCAALPKPEVNWHNCRFDGLKAPLVDLRQADISSALLRGAELSGGIFIDGNLQYVDFTGADLSYAQFMGARMKGANLQNSDLTNANLTDADLSFAILRDAVPGGIVMKNARFDNAIWFDGNECQPGSIGKCIVLN